MSRSSSTQGAASMEINKEALLPLILKGLRNPKYSRVSGFYCCNDRECRREQNRTFRMIRKARKIKDNRGRVHWDWFAPLPAEGVKPSKRANRGGW